MQALLVLLTIAALSLLASSRALDPGRFPALTRLAASGFLFLLFGVLLGPSVAGVLSARSVQGLRPVMALGLGTAGVIRRAQPEAPAAAAACPAGVLGRLAHAGTALPLRGAAAGGAAA
ncbi:sodium:proton exchanger, partial [Pyxidicoccus sp. 3LG]